MVNIVYICRNRYAESIYASQDLSQGYGFSRWQRQQCGRVDSKSAAIRSQAFAVKKFIASDFRGANEGLG